jgi:small subunit ribosomal protein S6
MDIQPKSFKNDYETMFILTPELSEAEQKVAADKFVQLIKDNDGEIVSTEHWGMRKLAYPIKKKTNGYYSLVEFRAFGDFIPRLEREYRYDDQVMRSMVVSLDKHAVAYNNKRRDQGFGARKEIDEKNKG